MIAEEKAKPAPLDPAKSAETATNVEFQEDDILQVLRLLARQAKINLVVDDSVSGTVTMRLQNKTPMEVIDVIVKAYDLVMKKEGEVYSINTKNPLSEDSASPHVQSIDVRLAHTMGPVILKLYDQALDHEAKPETAKKIAKAKRALFDALMAEGFTKEEALKITISYESDISWKNP